jgi:hypothetical protein
VTNSGESNLLQQHPSPDGARSYAALVEAVQAGDQQAMEELLMRSQEVAYRFSLLVCGRADDAEDAMQEALLKTFPYTVGATLVVARAGQAQGLPLRQAPTAQHQPAPSAPCTVGATLVVARAGQAQGLPLRQARGCPDH